MLQDTGFRTEQNRGGACCDITGEVNGGVGNGSLRKKSYCGTASKKVIKGGRREESCINKIISVPATNIDTKVKT